MMIRLCGVGWLVDEVGWYESKTENEMKMEMRTRGIV